MNIFLIIVVLVLSYFVVRYTLKVLNKSKYRTLIVVMTVFFSSVFVLFLILTRFIPNAVVEYVSSGINITENKLNEISPDYTNQVLDKEKISTFLQDTKQVRFNFNEYTEGVSFITRILGIDTYMFFYEDFAENLDNNIQLFEKNNIPFTMHNILQYIKDEVGVRINVIVGNIMLVLFFLALVVDGLILLFVVAMKKRWIDFDKKSIIFGEDI